MWTPNSATSESPPQPDREEVVVRIPSDQLFVFMVQERPEQPCVAGQAVADADFITRYIVEPIRATAPPGRTGPQSKTWDVGRYYTESGCFQRLLHLRHGRVGATSPCVRLEGLSFRRIEVKTRKPGEITH